MFVIIVTSTLHSSSIVVWCYVTSGIHGCQATQDTHKHEVIYSATVGSYWQCHST